MTSTYFSFRKSSVSAKLTLPKHRRASLRGGLWLPPAQRGSLLIPEFTEQMVHYPHDYQLFLALNDIEHTRTKANHPQTNGICERLNRTIQDEFYRVAFRKKLYRTIEELQVDLDAWLVRYNTERTNQGKHCKGRTPMQTFLEDRCLVIEKDLSRLTVPLAA